MHKTTYITRRKLVKTIKMMTAGEDTFDFSRWTVHNINESVQPWTGRFSRIVRTWLHRDA